MNARQQLGLAIATYECECHDRHYRRNIGSQVIQQAWNAVLCNLTDSSGPEEDVWRPACQYVSSQYVEST